METIFLPLINPGDYDAFRGIVNFGFPDTYEEWGKLHVKRVADIRGKGNRVKEIKVYPNKFAEYCRTRRHVPNPQLLDEFAIEQAPLQDK
jgi:hypothetical protein